MQYRIEHDTMGEVRVPADALWGAQTQRSHENFRIGGEHMPHEIIRAFALLKKAAACANRDLGKMDDATCELIGLVCDEILDGKLDDAFPLVVWQTGSRTQSNMNSNEVIANRGNEIAGSSKSWCMGWFSSFAIVISKLLNTVCHGMYCLIISG